MLVQILWGAYVKTRDLLGGEKMPVKGNGKRPEAGQEGCQTTHWSGSCEKEKEGRGLGEWVLEGSVFHLIKPMGVLDPKLPFREVLHFPGMGLPYLCPA